MIDIIKKTANRAGIDKAIGFSVLARAIQGFGGVVSVLLIARSLTQVEQGFYYTFASILAMQVFFELGFGEVIIQYVAHENSHLNWNADGTVYGDPKYISRIASLLRFCIRWYVRFAVLLIVFLIIAGIVYFNFFYQSKEAVSWIVPWCLICIGTTLNFMIAPISAFLQGLGRVREIAQYQFGAQFMMLLIVWSGLLFGAKLYVGGLASVVSALMFLGYLFFSRQRQVLLRLLKTQITDRVHYRNEIFPYQWKIALSWISGYFIFQLFNPVLFASEGPIVAGQMGMTLTILNPILALTMTWITTKLPIFSGLIAQRKYTNLDKLFKHSFIQSFILNVLALVVFLGVVVFIRSYDIKIGGKYLGERFLPYWPMIFMMISFLLNQMVGSMAIYLRCHKQEPMMIYSVVIGVLCSLSTVLTGNYLGVKWMTFSYMLLCIIGFIWTYFIFKTKRKEWHE